MIFSTFLLLSQKEIVPLQRKNHFEDVRAPVQRTQTLVPAACIVLGLGLISQKRFRPASKSELLGLSLDRAIKFVFFDFGSSHHNVEGRDNGSCICFLWNTIPLCDICRLRRRVQGAFI